MFAVALVYFLTVDSSVSHALPVVEQNSAPPQFVVYGVGRAADLLCDAAKGASVSMSDLDDDALFKRKMRPFSAGRICGTIYLIRSDTSLGCWFADYILP